MYSLEFPLILLLAPLPLLIARVPIQQKIPVILARFVSNYRHIIANTRRNRVKLTLLWFTWLNLLLSLANPQKTTHIAMHSSDKATMFVLDISYSMEANFSEIKEYLSDFFSTAMINAGIIAFGLKPYLVSPITPFTISLVDLLDRMTIGLADETELSGSSINDAIYLAIVELIPIKSDEKSIILITDGEDTNSRLSYDYVSNLAIENNITIHKASLPLDSSSLPKVEKIEKATTALSLFKVPLWLAFLGFAVLIFRFGKF